MRVVPLPNGQRLWQFVATQFRPVDDPWAQYAHDSLIDQYVLATYLINTVPFLAPLTLFSYFTPDLWPGGYFLAVPTDEEVESFPDLVTPAEAAAVLGYALGVDTDAPMLSFPEPVREVSVTGIPGWVVRFCVRTMILRRAMGLTSKPGFCRGVSIEDWAEED